MGPAGSLTFSPGAPGIAQARAQVRREQAGEQVGCSWSPRPAPLAEAARGKPRRFVWRTPSSLDSVSGPGVAGPVGGGECARTPLWVAPFARRQAWEKARVRARGRQGGPEGTDAGPVAATAPRKPRSG